MPSREVANGLTPFNTRFDDNRFGGQIGGPVIKDKLFFFTAWQYEPVGLAGNSVIPLALRPRPAMPR